LRPYEKDPSAIYAASFATVAQEARLDRFDAAMHPLITRVIHACGMVEIADRLAWSQGAIAAGQAALKAGKPIFCDCEMVGAGIIRRYLPANNDVIVTLNDPTVPDHAAKIGTHGIVPSVGTFRCRRAGACRYPWLSCGFCWGG
jgi:precorrin-8X/cobalt-precorrin-8 methylmutase